MFQTIDHWIIERVRQTVEFLNDWLGIPQKWVERALIVGQVVSRCVIIYFHPPYESVGLLMLFGGYFTWWMWSLHRKPVSVRTAQYGASRMGTLARTLWYIFIAIDFGITIFSHGRQALMYQVGELGTDFTILGLIILMIVNVDGERLGKAKMAWSKVKELFGTAWIPQPAGAK